MRSRLVATRSPISGRARGRRSFFCTDGPWTVESGDTDLALRAVLNAWAVWLPRGYILEATAWVSRLLIFDSVDPELKFAALGIAQLLARYRRDDDRVRLYLEQMRAVADQDASAGEMAVVQREAALLARDSGEFREAIELLEDARRLIQTGHTKRGVSKGFVVEAGWYAVAPCPQWQARRRLTGADPQQAVL